ncbi:periplasmic binding protein [Methanolacinia petrolearia DSM 11571]|uniref:Periplasmic binding protein n=1 Tax=Methanolacinia petrolearia (strain DSM 11571 / OCM 486 / SEBR 4847) TaxID=679926 RepID=E1RG26_METP4|nr:ABC transporter substrate-binding protein [Methanolacinia petrolearia]ADN36261.1 periplasmic binding protein [Methanolacinia petrolearia DSM 11571]
MFQKPGIFIAIFLVVVAMTAAILLLTTGEEENEALQAEDRITITDAYGREVTLDGPAERVAYSHHSLSDSLRLIGAWDQVVGRDANIDDEHLFPGFEDIPEISQKMNAMDLNYEEIVEIHPDVLILPKFDWYTGADDIIQTLEPDIPVVFLNTLDPSPEIFNETIQKLGLITGNEERADEYLEFYNGVYDTIVSKTSLVDPEDRPRVFFRGIGKTSADQIVTYGKDMEWFQNFLDAAGAENVAKDLPISYGDVDREWLLEQDIDVIVVKCWEERYPGVFGYSATDRGEAIAGAEEIRNAIMEMDVFSNTDAVRNGDVYLFDDSMDATQRNIVGLAYLAKWLYPEEFSDLDPEAVHQEYISRFMEADYNLSQSGLFAYPAEAVV